MISTPEAAQTYVSLLALASIWTLYFFFYHDYRIDLFRQRMFKLRAELFALGLSGEIPFNNHAYGMLRSTINGYIRFGHRLGVIWFLATEEVLQEKDTSDAVQRRGYQRRFNESIQPLGPEARDKLNGILGRLNDEIMKHMLVKSPLTLLLLIGVGVVMFAAFGARRAALSAAGRWRRLSFEWREVRDQLLDQVNSTAFAEGIR